MKNNHKTEWVKVNVPVDSGVKGIVSALSDFPQLETIESCEGHNGDPIAEANMPHAIYSYLSHSHGSNRFFFQRT